MTLSYRRRAVERSRSTGPTTLSHLALRAGSSTTMMACDEPARDNNIIALDLGSHNEPAPGTSKDYVSPKEVMPFPKADRTKQKKAGRRKKGTTRVYTDTPVRNEVAEAKSLSKKTVERKKKSNQGKACLPQVILMFLRMYRLLIVILAWTFSWLMNLTMK